jgi:hypothetical protein
LGGAENINIRYDGNNGFKPGMDERKGLHAPPKFLLANNLGIY